MHCFYKLNILVHVIVLLFIVAVAFESRQKANAFSIALSSPIHRQRSTCCILARQTSGTNDGNAVDFEVEDTISDLWFSVDNDDDEEEIDIGKELGLDEFSQLRNTEHDDKQEVEKNGAELNEMVIHPSDKVDLGVHVAMEQGLNNDDSQLWNMEDNDDDKVAKSKVRDDYEVVDNKDGGETKEKFQKPSNGIEQNSPWVSPATLRMTQSERNKSLWNSKTSKKDSSYWDLRLKHLLEYHRCNGHIDVPFLYTTDLSLAIRCEPPNNQNGETSESSATIQDRLHLGAFIAWLRSVHGKDELQIEVPPHVIEELNRLGMNWEMGRGWRPQLFKSRIEEWKAISDDKNNSSVDESVPLRTWMWKQRYLHDIQQQGRYAPLTHNRVKELTKVGILPYQRSQATMQLRFDTQWENFFLQWQQASPFTRSGTTEDGGGDIELSYWVWEQQRMYDAICGKTSSLVPLPSLITGYRLQALKEVSFFSKKERYPPIPPEKDVATVQLDWEAILTSLRKLQANEGHCRVGSFLPFNIEDATVYSMCRRLIWEYKHIQQDRQDLFLNHHDYFLNDERIQQLNELNFFEETRLETNATAEYQWWESYHGLKRYYTFQGNFNVSSREFPELHEWLQVQQQQYQNTWNGSVKGNTLSEVHYVALSKLGMVFEEFDATPTNEAMFKPPASHTARGSIVGRRPAIIELESDTITTRDYSSLISRKKKDAVEDLVWMARYEEMCQFIGEHGHCDVPKADHAHLALWVYNQRIQYTRSLQGKALALTPEKITLLKATEFDFAGGLSPITGLTTKKSSTEDEWDDMLQALVMFKETRGDCYVPATLPSNPRLGRWIHNLRQSYQQQHQHQHQTTTNLDRDLPNDGPSSIKVVLEKEKIHILLDTGLDLKISNFQYSRKAFQALWDDRLRQLVQFKSDYGHLDVGREQSNHYVGLDNWETYIKQTYKIEKLTGVSSCLSKDRIKELISIGFTLEVDNNI